MSETEFLRYIQGEVGTIWAGPIEESRCLGRLVFPSVDREQAVAYRVSCGGLRVRPMNRSSDDSAYTSGSNIRK